MDTLLLQRIADVLERSDLPLIATCNYGGAVVSVEFRDGPITKGQWYRLANAGVPMVPWEQRAGREREPAPRKVGSTAKAESLREVVEVATVRLRNQFCHAESYAAAPDLDDLELCLKHVEKIVVEIREAAQAAQAEDQAPEGALRDLGIPEAEVSRMAAASPLLPPPGDEVAQKLIAEVRRLRGGTPRSTG